MYRGYMQAVRAIHSPNASITPYHGIQDILEGMDPWTPKSWIPGFPGTPENDPF